MRKLINTIGIGSMLWVAVDVALPFIPFGGLAFSTSLLYIFYLVLSRTLFKDGKRTESQDLISSRVSEMDRETADQSIHNVNNRIKELDIDIDS